jgi:hypothetical protein
VPKSPHPAQDRKVLVYKPSQYPINPTCCPSFTFLSSSSTYIIMSWTQCESEEALRLGARPNRSAQKVQCGVCTTRCIYCDIWKLATLICSHTPLSFRRTSLAKLRRHSITGSPSPIDSIYEFEQNEKVIEARFQTQKARLTSIMSISVVDGTQECEGLRRTHDRCLYSVMDLMHQEQMLDDRGFGSRCGPQCSNMSKTTNRDCASRQDCIGRSHGISMLGVRDGRARTS